jgi:uncharacterized membrane protein HdeD (DUF308 family)
MTTATDAAMHGGTMSRNINTLAKLIADRWWTLVVRGVAGIAFGIFTLVAPRTSLLAIVYVWGAYAIIDGIGALASAWRNDRGGRGWLIFEGIVGIGAGIVAFAWTGLTALFLLIMIASWAVITGVIELIAAFRLRREIEGEWLLAASGVLSVILGIVLFMAPGAGIVALLWTIGVYAIVFGGMLIALGFRVRSWRHAASRETAPPAEAMPSRA